ncbi:MAG: hypothetical protein WCH40_05230 [Verrucomicrobiales bacterium]
MPTSFQDSRDKLLGQLVDFLWRQWTSLGVPGNRASEGDWIIDPEALVLITTDIGRHDTRLLDLAIDWLHSYGRSINLQRLRRLQGQWPASDERVLSGISDILAEQSVMRKWQLLRESHRFPDPAESLFVSITGASPPVFGEPDPRFERYGLLRTRWEPRNACQPPRSDLPCNLLWTLRALFGVNARAEIMAWLLTHESGHPAAIAMATGYFSKSIQVTLNEMEQSGHVRSERDGREKKFRLHRPHWSFLIASPDSRSFPRWINWPPLFYFAFRTLDLLGKAETPGASETLRAIQQRGFLDEIAPALRESGLRSNMTTHRDLTGSRLTEAILRDVEELGRMLDSDFVGNP